ncbi:hypothetical protein BC831DRAFT_137375 [Entophlyctis helioformis]|nr:hypothetical protein BC831DRAFT_137375 [Entophlyctis helioformis]
MQTGAGPSNSNSSSNRPGAQLQQHGARLTTAPLSRRGVSSSIRRKSLAVIGDGTGAVINIVAKAAKKAVLDNVFVKSTVNPVSLRFDQADAEKTYKVEYEASEICRLVFYASFFITALQLWDLTLITYADSPSGRHALIGFNIVCIFVLAVPLMLVSIDKPAKRKAAAVTWLKARLPSWRIMQRAAETKSARVVPMPEPSETQLMSETNSVLSSEPADDLYGSRRTSINMTPSHSFGPIAGRQRTRRGSVSSNDGGSLFDRNDDARSVAVHLDDDVRAASSPLAHLQERRSSKAELVMSNGGLVSVLPALIESNQRSHKRTTTVSRRDQSRDQTRDQSRDQSRDLIRDKDRQERDRDSVSRSRDPSPSRNESTNRRRASISRSFTGGQPITTLPHSDSMPMSHLLITIGDGNTTGHTSVESARINSSASYGSTNININNVVPNTPATGREHLTETADEALPPGFSRQRRKSTGAIGYEPLMTGSRAASMKIPPIGSTSDGFDSETPGFMSSGSMQQAGAAGPGSLGAGKTSMTQIATNVNSNTETDLSRRKKSLQRRSKGDHPYLYMLLTSESRTKQIIARVALSFALIASAINTWLVAPSSLTVGTGNIIPIAIAIGCLGGLALPWIDSCAAILLALIIALIPQIIAYKDSAQIVAVVALYVILLFILVPMIHTHEARRRYGFVRSKMVESQREILAKKQRQVDYLLAGCLPKRIIPAMRLVEGVNGYGDLSKRYEKATCLFVEITTPWTNMDHLESVDDFDNALQHDESSDEYLRDTVETLNNFFEEFDKILRGYDTVEKIKVIGGAKIMLCSGMDDDVHPNRATEDMIRLAIDYRRWFNEQHDSMIPGLGFQFSIRMGIFRGELVAGIIGKKNIVYDVIGDCVNCASCKQLQSRPRFSCLKRFAGSLTTTVESSCSQSSIPPTSRARASCSCTTWKTAARRFSTWQQRSACELTNRLACCQWEAATSVKARQEP